MKQKNPLGNSPDIRISGYPELSLEKCHKKMEVGRAEDFSRRPQPSSTGLWLIFMIEKHISFSGHSQVSRR
jgi:hypothetical protein